MVDDARVDGAVEGVALLDLPLRVDALLRSRILREKEGKLRSSLCVTLCAEASADRLRFEVGDS